MTTVQYNCGRYDKPRIVSVSGTVVADGPAHLAIQSGGMVHRIHRSRIRWVRSSV